VTVLYLDTSAVLRATLESGMTPELEEQIHAAEALVTSRLSLVESARALLRARELYRISEEQLADVQRELDEVWARCEIWELTASVCDAACVVAPRRALRALDALHLATYLAARRRIPELELVTVDERLRAAVS